MQRNTDVVAFAEWRSQLHREPHRLRAVLLIDECDHALAQPKRIRRSVRRSRVQGRLAIAGSRREPQAIRERLRLLAKSKVDVWSLAAGAGSQGGGDSPEPQVERSAEGVCSAPGTQVGTGCGLHTDSRHPTIHVEQPRLPTDIGRLQVRHLQSRQAARRSEPYPLPPSTSISIRHAPLLDSPRHDPVAHGALRSCWRADVRAPRKKGIRPNLDLSQGPLSFGAWGCPSGKVCLSNSSRPSGVTASTWTAVAAPDKWSGSEGAGTRAITRPAALRTRTLSTSSARWNVIGRREAAICLSRSMDIPDLLSDWRGACRRQGTATGCPLSKIMANPGRFKWVNCSSGSNNPASCRLP
jgi:hypothetical protein